MNRKEAYRKRLTHNLNKIQTPEGPAVLISDLEDFMKKNNIFPQTYKEFTDAIKEFGETILARMKEDLLS